MNKIKMFYNKKFGVDMPTRKVGRMKPNMAFTLAEILITLGVIGVVAAITMPTLINKHRELATVAKVKKFYSIMSQAYMLSVKDNGYVNEWNVGNKMSATTATQVAKYLTPYLKIIKDCGTNSGCLGYTERVNLLNGSKHDVNYDTNKSYYKIILSDGSYAILRGPGGDYCKGAEDGQTNICGVIFFDINGGKAPNTVGKDIFEILLTVNGIVPAISGDCSTSSKGWSCSGYILKNGNMDYLH